MSEPAQAGKTCDLRGIREAVCVHTGKITDSCLAKDCIEDLRVYLTVDSQQTLDCAASAKARYVELLFTQVQVEPVPYSSGYFTVDVTFYYRCHCRRDALGRTHEYRHGPCRVLQAAGSVRRGNERTHFLQPGRSDVPL